MHRQSQRDYHKRNAHIYEAAVNVKELHEKQDLAGSHVKGLLQIL